MCTWHNLASGFESIVHLQGALTNDRTNYNCSLCTVSWISWWRRRSWLGMHSKWQKSLEDHTTSMRCRQLRSADIHTCTVPQTQIWLGDTSFAIICQNQQWVRYAWATLGYSSLPGCATSRPTRIAHGTSFLILSVSLRHWTSLNDCWKLTCFLSVLTSCRWLFFINCWSGPWSDFALTALYKLAFLRYITLHYNTILAHMVVGHSLLLARLPGTHWMMICMIRRLALTVSDVCSRLVCFQSTSTSSA